MTSTVYNNMTGGIIMENEVLQIGNNIKLLREQSGFTQSNLARYLKVDQSLISKIEKNERALTSDMLDKLAALFGIAVEGFYQDTIPVNRISFALRASEIDEDDLKTISDINRIVLNLNFMTNMLGGI